MKCYIASPWFDKKGLGLHEIRMIKDVLKHFNFTWFSPKDENLIKPDAILEIRKQGFKKNIDEINKCDFMIANTRDKDLGVSIEMGYAYAHNKPIFLFTPQIKDMPINLMLSELCVNFSFDKDTLKKQLHKYFVKNEISNFEGEII